jgi:hypothetical protein
MSDLKACISVHKGLYIRELAQHTSEHSTNDTTFGEHMCTVLCEQRRVLAFVWLRVVQIICCFTVI